MVGIIVKVMANVLKCVMNDSNTVCVYNEMLSQLNGQVSDESDE